MISLLVEAYVCAGARSVFRTSAAPSCAMAMDYDSRDTQIPYAVSQEKYGGSFYH
jgi:hypothetical protein